MESKEVIQASKLSDIEQRRARLKQELDTLERGLEGNIDEIKEGLQQKTDPRHWIRVYPLAALGIAVGVGILVGSSGGRKRNRSAISDGGPSLFGELKRLLLMKGIAFAVASAEELLSDRLSPNPRLRKTQEVNDK